MTGIDALMKPPTPDRELKAIACALCVWVIVIALCWSFLTSKPPVHDFGSAGNYVIVGLFAFAIIIVSIYMIGRAILKLYKYR